MVGTRIRYYRKRAGMTLEQLAEGICSVSYLSKIEHGDKSSDEVVKLLCKRLEISYDDVNNEEELNETSHMLDQWYKEMISGLPGQMEEKRELLMGRMSDIEDPLIILRYELYNIRFLLFKNELEAATKQFKFVKGYKEIFTKEMIYYYHNFSGIYQCMARDFQKSLEHFDEARERLTTIKHDEQEEAELWYQIALVENEYYHVTKCINFANKALNIFNKQYNLKRIADCQTLLGISNRRINNFVQAEHHYEQSLKFIELLNDDYRKAVILHNLGVIKSFQSSPEEAIDYYEQSLENQKNSGVLSKITTIYCLALEYYNLQKFDQCQEHIHKGEDLLSPSTHKDYALDFKILKLKTEQIRDNRFEELLRKDAIPYYEKVHRWDKVEAHAIELADYYFDHGQYKRSSQYYRLANKASKNKE